MVEKKKLLNIGIVLLIIIFYIMFIIDFRKKDIEDKYDQAQKLFEEQVIPEIRKEMRKSGETDLEISAEYCEYKWEEWSREVSLSYSSESIDQFYTTEWEDDNCTQLVADLKYMRNIRDKYCGEYTYQVEGKEIHIFFKDSYTDFFHVRSSNHEYHIYTYNAKTSLSIDGDLMYYSGGASVNTEASSGTKSNSTSNGTSKKSYSGKSKKQKTQKSNPYDVYDYSNAEDFYDDNYDDFWNYEEAEDYYNEAWD